MKTRIVFGFIFAAAVIASASAVTSCWLDKQFLTFQLDCLQCSLNITDDPTCCHAITGDVIVSDSTNASCCTDIQPPVLGLITCQINSVCYQQFYGQYLSDLTLRVNETVKDFSACNALMISTTPAYQTTTECAVCDVTAPTTPSSSPETKIPSILFITICQLLWIGFAS
jgi:hypothetical protein